MVRAGSEGAVNASESNISNVRAKGLFLGISELKTGVYLAVIGEGRKERRKRTQTNPRGQCVLQGF
jgi:hypothetical protein